MWGYKKLEAWVEKNFALKADVSFDSRRYWELMAKGEALYQHLGVEYKECPGRYLVVKKGGKECQP